MGWGSAGTPPWVDEKAIDKENREKEISEYEARIKSLEDENKKLKEKIKKLEEAINEK